MKTILRTTWSMLLFSLAAFSARAQGTAFTYQGSLTSGGVPANGSFDLAFSLCASANGGAPVAGPITNTAVAVSNGLFTVSLDFGNVFSGGDAWLLVAVQTNGGSGFAALSPLQPITPTPYAIYAPTAGAAASVSGPISLAQLPASLVTNGETGLSISGNFVGNGGGLTNLNASQLSSGAISSSLLPSNVLTTVRTIIQSNVYSTAGVTMLMVPAGATNMTAKLWGAGGGGGLASTGGAGAFSQMSLAVVPGQTFTVVVGQHGNYTNNNNGGGIGSGDASGGIVNPGAKAGEGGQASSLFLNSGTNYLTVAVAGGGGGAGAANASVNGGAGGNPGQAGASAGGTGGSNGIGGASVPGGTAGDNYSAAATNTGIASLGSVDGQGGSAVSTTGSGGGGGGFGGGASGGSSQSGGGGGGSYGATIIGGTNYNAGNTGDPSYIIPNGSGGQVQTPGADGLVVITFGGFETTTSSAIAAAGFSGSGAGLTNVNTSSLVGGALPASILPTNIFTTVLVGAQTNAIQTNVYSSAGTITVTVPPNATLMTAKLWGAGGGGGHGSGVSGGAGAFVEQSVDVAPGQTFLVVVGQHGDSSDNNAGGAGSGDAAGGQSSGGGGLGQGGQASSLFYQNGVNYIVKAIAGGGGGGGYSYSGGAGGNPGQTLTGGGGGGGNGLGGAAGSSASGAGGNYASTATNAGLASVSAAGGSGGYAAPGGSDGGGGGGYGGGGGGSQYAFGGGGGGGSYGSIIVGGNGNVPGNTGDSSYTSPSATGGASQAAGADGLVVITFSIVQTIPTVYISAAGFSGDGSGLTNLNASKLVGSLPAISGASLTDLNASQLTTGTVPLAQLPSAVVTNNESGVTLSNVTLNGTTTAASLNGATITANAYSGGSIQVSAVIATSEVYCYGPVYGQAFDYTSDRTAKENFAAVNPLEVLEKVVALPVTKWNYKAAQGQPHIGPMAQDFHAAFKLNGSDEKHISVVDETGVALAAIQGLNQKLEGAEKALKEKDAEVQELRSRLEKLEQMMTAKNALIK